MAIAGIIFEHQVLTAKGLRGGFQAALTDGILSGCNITASGNTVTIEHGLMCIGGGIFAITGAQSFTITGTSGVARIKAVVDTSKTSTTEQFDQVNFVIDQESAENLLPAMQQDDINSGSGQIYQAPICILSLGASGVTEILKTYKSGPRIAYGDVLPETATEGTIFLLKTN